MALIHLAMAVALSVFPDGFGGRGGAPFAIGEKGGTPTEPVREVQYVEPNDFWYVARYLMNESEEIGDGTEFAPATIPYAQWHTMDDYLNLRRAWAVTTGSDDVVIAVIDQEVQWGHYDLIDNIWTNPDETADNGIDDDGNGLVDDVHGWNFIGNTNNPAHDTAQGDDCTESDSQHGTQMAGILGAQGNNEAWTDTTLTPNTTTHRQGSVGVAWDVSILPCKAILSEAAASGAYGMGGGRVEAAEYVAYMATNQAAPIAACSMSYTQINSYTVSRLVDANILPVTGAGNTGSALTWGASPGMGDSMLVVAAIGPSMVKADYSRWGPDVDLCAYGGGQGADPGAPYYQFSWSPGGCPCGWKKIVPGWSAWPFIWTLGWAPVDAAGSESINWLGNETSSAATGLAAGEPRQGILPSPGMTSGTVPMVAGVCALIKTSVFSAASWSSLQSLVLRACKGADAIASANPGYSGGLGSGALDAYRAVTLWGKVPVSTFGAALSGDVYVSGDLLLSGSGVVTVADSTTFWIAPDDLYEGIIEPGDDAPAAWLFDRSTEITSEPANRLTPAGVCIYIASGVYVNCGAGVTFRSWAKNPGSDDWEGVHPLAGGLLLGSPTILNSAN